jgi:hypothetical protein
VKSQGRSAMKINSTLSLVSFVLESEVIFFYLVYPYFFYTFRD